MSPAQPKHTWPSQVLQPCTRPTMLPSVGRYWVGRYVGSNRRGLWLCVLLRLWRCPCVCVHARHVRSCACVMQVPRECELSTQGEGERAAREREPSKGNEGKPAQKGAEPAVASKSARWSKVRSFFDMLRAGHSACASRRPFLVLLLEWDRHIYIQDACKQAYLAKLLLRHLIYVIHLLLPATQLVCLTRAPFPHQLVRCCRVGTRFSARRPLSLAGSRRSPVIRSQARCAYAPRTVGRGMNAALL